MAAISPFFGKLGMRSPWLPWRLCLDHGVLGTYGPPRFVEYDPTTSAASRILPWQVHFLASAYEFAPWGNQTVISRVFRYGSAAKFSAGGITKNCNSFTTAGVSAGAADLVRDNGFNTEIDYKPVSYLDLESDFSRSVPLQLNSYSLGVGVDLSWLLRPHVH